MTASVRERLQPLAARWSGLDQRERRLVLLAAALVGVALIWLLALQPALKTLSAAPAQIDRLDAEMQTMQALAADVRELRAAPPVPRAQASAALRSAAERLGDQARLAEQGDRAVLTLKDISGPQLQSWLAEVRATARARAVDVNLTRSEQGLTGTVVVALPGG